MKVSDYVANFLAKRGVTHAFVVSGGASLHLIHSIADEPGIDYVCPLHEQAGAMAADGYARASGRLGVAIATSGPGATNMITGVCSAYYDSIPSMFITGQVATFRMTGNTGVRQIGFQETPSVNIYRSITKYAVQITDPLLIRYELEKAHHIATSGRPGPVLLDIPDDLQRAAVDPAVLQSFVPNEPAVRNAQSGDVSRCLELLYGAQRPVIIVGWGVHLAHAESELLEFVNTLSFPVATTWAAADMLPHSHPLLIGTFGTYGCRHSNFAVQNADLVVSIGSRLDTKATGTPVTTFAREARKVVVDIDKHELRKFAVFGLDIDVLIECGAKEFLQQANQDLVRSRVVDVSGWKAWIDERKRKYPVCPTANFEEAEVNPYVFVKRLSQAAEEGDVIVVDTGCSVAWMMQAFEFKLGQRLYHDFNNTAMGWALPASIGASFGRPGCRIICVTGDGSLQMNIQELATVMHYRLPIKIFLMNNHGYSMIRQTQDQWLAGRYLASCELGGVASPDFVAVSEAYGYKVATIDSNHDMAPHIRSVLSEDGPIVCNVMIGPTHRVIPQVKYGRPNEDAEPLLARPEFLSNMLVSPMPISLEE